MPPKVQLPEDILAEAENDLRHMAGLLEHQPAALAQDAGSLNLLLEVSQRLNRVTNIDQLLDVIMDSVMQLTRAERGFLMLHDAEGVLRFRVIRNATNQVWEGEDYQVSHTITEQVVSSAQPLWVRDTGQDPRLSQSASVADLRIRSCLCVPLFAGQAARTVTGVIYVDSQQVQQGFEPRDLDLLTAIAGQAAIAIENAQLIAGIKALEEEKRRALEQENLSLQKMLEAKGELLGQCPGMEQVFSMIRRVAGSEVSVLVLGESGTGKSLVARAIHDLSLRKDKPFIVIDCGAIPENLLESELFGYEKGAFTGAYGRKLGKFELADGGTVFLDEIGELPPALQLKLLRVLQEGQLEHIGGRETIKVDVRVVTATNRDLARDVESGRFRKDLFYRLNVITILLPSLRDRGDDILMLASVFLERFAAKHKKRIAAFGSDAKAALLAHGWPGNVRELEHKVERAVIMCDGARIDAGHLELAAPPGAADKTCAPSPGRLKDAKSEIERTLLAQALSACQGDITATARQLGIARQQIYRMMKKYKVGYEPPKK
ncbi:MAG: sigma-54-dependent Fis family transcriptional regulator [Candidatus Edwardsbacteria bacterium]|jgi:Nif-specific regulatory protein|nr:sigma-54-dependent Fis family transcriptional regulator [Candidatus Edwardsbacteria bacterium]